MARGEHIKVKRCGGLYSHHGIDMGDGTVIHFSGEPLHRQNARICRVSLREFLAGGTLELVRHREAGRTLAASAEAALRERVALRLRIAEAAERCGDLAEAEQQLACVLAEQPGHRDALRRIRLIYAARREEDKTLATLAELIAGAASPRERAEWLSERATLLSERGDRPAALADYRQILALIPGDERTLQRMRALVD